MVIQLQNPSTEIIYPESDGQPMSDNTKQYLWMVLIKEALEWLFQSDPNVFVAGNLLWYPVEGRNKIRNANSDRLDDDSLLSLRVERSGTKQSPDL